MESIGKRLREEREKKGVSLEEASSQTRIHHRVLKALEENRFDDIPSPMYAKGFLKKYADYLGLDSKLMVEKYLATHPRAPEQVLILEGESIGRKHFRRFLIPVGVTFVILAVLAISFYLIVKSLASRSKETTPEVVKVEKGVAVKETKETTSEVDKAKSPLPTAKPKAPGEPFNLTVRATQKVWLQVTSDGTVIFQDVLSPGDVESWQANDELVLSCGNAGGIELSLDGKTLGLPGKPGQVIKNLVFTREGMKAEIK